jgi:hypothetical protein
MLVYFLDILVYFTTIWYILWQFVIFLPIWYVVPTKKNMATLLSRHGGKNIGGKKLYGRPLFEENSLKLYLTESVQVLHILFYLVFSYLKILIPQPTAIT